MNTQCLEPGAATGSFVTDNRTSRRGSYLPAWPKIIDRAWGMACISLPACREGHSRQRALTDFGRSHYGFSHPASLLKLTVCSVRNFTAAECLSSATPLARGFGSTGLGTKGPYHPVQNQTENRKNLKPKYRFPVFWFWFRFRHGFGSTGLGKKDPYITVAMHGS